MQRSIGLQQQERHTHAYNSRIYDGKIAGLYDLEETLGSGHFAVVKLARHVFTGEKVAVKVIDKTKLDDISKAHLFQEVRCMKLVQHPHVVRLYEVIDTQTKLYLILELADGGDLYDYIMRHESGLSEKLAKEYFRQIVRAISYCHELHVVHRDLKPENVVFFEKLGVVKLTDFGFSNKFCPGQKLETSCGSLAYSAPEILLGDSYDAPAVDVWSLGVILYMLVCGQPPFQEANDSETLTMIMDCKYTMPQHVSIGCSTLISSMLVREPEKRATLQQIANDGWLMEDTILHPQHPDQLPLISREQVSEEDHSLIIQKMVNGNIAQKDEVLEALDRNEYNHITATYFLLAERKLRAHRQDQPIHNKNKLDLSLHLQSTVAGGTNRTTQNTHFDEDEKETNFLVVPGVINVPRTPGAESTQKIRNRKCSIVAEEEEDYDYDPCSGEHLDEMSPPLNRRGSRSEGRINVTVQERLSVEVAERIKKEQKILKNSDYEMKSTPKLGLIDGIAGIKIIKSDDSSKEKFLGQAGAGGGRGKERSTSIEAAKQKNSRELKVLIGSSTIPAISSSSSSSFKNQIPKPYKTMPSPIRPILDSGSTINNCLKEIFEEYDAVSSDNNSNSNTPEPAVKSNQSSIESHQQRRTKFNKSRTQSWSSSDDDDNPENRKKRESKIIDNTSAKQFMQRRDSYDDSSDSQDPGTACSGSNNTAVGSSLLLKNGSSSSTSTKSNNNKNTSQTGNRNQENRGKTTSSNSPEIGYRRHRTGRRRRQTETRLRESQSLNRITEVQECEHNNNNIVIVVVKPKEDQEVNVLPPPNTQNSKADIMNATNELKANKNQNNNKAKSFSARFLQNLNFKRSYQGSHDINQQSTNSKNNHKLNRRSIDETSFLKLSCSKSTLQTNHVADDRSRKIKILGRYFQVHKKLCQPLSGLFHRNSASTNLYKAQSCSSIIRDGIVHSTNTINTNHLSTSSSSMSKNTTKSEGKLLKEQDFIIKNCINSHYAGSDGDITSHDITGKMQDKHTYHQLEYIDADLLSGNKR